MTRNEWVQMLRREWAFRTWMFNMAPAHRSKGRLTHVQRTILGYKSTKAERHAKKVKRQRRRLGRLHNGRK